MLTFDRFQHVITQEKKGKTVPELGYWVYKWQDMKIVITKCGRGLKVVCVNQFDEPLYFRNGEVMDENTNFGMYEMHKVTEMWHKAIEIANRFYEARNTW
jgi:hypothetical protein